MKLETTDKYDDILYLPHHQSNKHPHMSLHNRAAQFSPFAALTGYEDEIEETGRLTKRQRELDENEKEILDQKFMMLLDEMPRPVLHRFTYYVPDEQKEGGDYQEVRGIVKKIDLTLKKLVLYAEDQVRDGQIIPIASITDIE